MKHRNHWKAISILLAALLVLAVVSTAPGQESESETDSQPASTSTTGEKPGISDLEGVRDQEEISGETLVVAQPPYAMNYQGYLTDVGGNPLTGTHNLSFSLFDAATGGNLEWGPEAHSSVQVTDGLFSVVLGQTVDLYPDVFVKALFLAVTVDGTVLATRQPLRTVSYAYGLVPGAKVHGAPTVSIFGLEVYNTDTTPDDTGIHAVGWKHGIIAEEVNPAAGNDVGIYSPDFVEAQGYKSIEDSYLWVPAMAGVASSALGPTVETWYTGRVVLTSPAADTRYFYLPVALPSLMYGQEVTVKSLTVYYSTSDPATYIDATNMRKLIDSTTPGESLISDTTNRTSTTATFYTIPTSGNNRLDASSGPVTVQLVLNFANTAHSITVGGIRLQLGHMDP